MLGIEHLLDRRPWELSGGERQRVTLGRAIVRQPAAFLLDEPLSNLEASLRAPMRRELKLMQQRLNATMVYVTHDHVEAMTLADRIVVMDRGVIQQIGPPREVHEKPRNLFVAGFFGAPTMNFIRGRGTREAKGWRFESGQLLVRLNDPQATKLNQKKTKELVLAVRPEHVHIQSTGDSRQLGPADGYGRVTLTEMLGATTLVSLEVDARPIENRAVKKMETGHAPLACVTPTEEALKIGTQVAIRIDASQAVLFDAQTGENLQWSHSNHTLPYVPS